MNIDYTTYVAHAKNFRQRFLILHYTAGNFRASIDELIGKDVSSHYVVPTLTRIDPTYPNNKLIVYSLVAENERAWHAGVSSWQGRTSLNDSSIGIEIVNQTTDTKFEPYPDEQIDLLIELCENILPRYPDITATHILGYSDIAVGRKIDPGPLFPWKKLYDKGVGAWYDKDTVEYYKGKFIQAMPCVEDVVKKLNDYGYRYSGEASTLFKAFQSKRLKKARFSHIISLFYSFQKLISFYSIG